MENYDVDSSCLRIKDFHFQNSQVDMLLSVDTKIYDCDSCVQFFFLLRIFMIFFHVISLLFNLYIQCYMLR